MNNKKITSLRRISQLILYEYYNKKINILELKKLKKIIELLINGNESIEFFIKKMDKDEGIY